jgi:hypothetical protein
LPPTTRPSGRGSPAASPRPPERLFRSPPPRGARRTDLGHRS